MGFVGDFFTEGSGPLGGLTNNKLADPFGIGQGKREGHLTDEQVKAAEQQNQIARALFSQATSPALRLFFGDPENQGAGGIFPEFLRSGELPQALSLDPNFSSTRDVTERQFNVARENILNRTPARGGQLNDLLANLEVERAITLSDQALQQNLLEAPIRSGLFEQGFNTAFGFPSTSLGGLGSAGSLFNAAANRSAQIQQARVEETQNAMSEVLSIAGFFGGGK